MITMVPDVHSLQVIEQLQRANRQLTSMEIVQEIYKVHNNNIM